MAAGGTASTHVHDGAILGGGAQVAGPAIAEEEAATIVIDPGWTAELIPSGCRTVRERA